MLYHYTSLDGLARILNNGIIKPFRSHSPFPCVWLTPESDCFAAAYKHGIPWGRTEVRIAFAQDDRFIPFCCVGMGAHELAFHKGYAGWTDQWIAKAPIDIFTAAEIAFRPDVTKYIEYCKRIRT